MLGGYRGGCRPLKKALPHLAARQPVSISRLSSRRFSFGVRRPYTMAAVAAILGIDIPDILSTYLAFPTYLDIPGHTRYVVRHTRTYPDIPIISRHTRHTRRHTRYVARHTRGYVGYVGYVIQVCRYVTIPRYVGRHTCPKLLRRSRVCRRHTCGYVAGMSVTFP